MWLPVFVVASGLSIGQVRDRDAVERCRIAMLYKVGILLACTICSFSAWLNFVRVGFGMTAEKKLSGLFSEYPRLLLAPLESIPENSSMLLLVGLRSLFIHRSSQSRHRCATPFVVVGTARNVQSYFFGTILSYRRITQLVPKNLN